MVFSVPSRGIGKPDYSREVSASRQRAGLSLSYGQSLKIWGIVFSAIPSPFPWVSGLLAAGASESLVDNETGQPMPFVVPKGSTLAILAGGGSVSEDSVTRVYLDGFLAISMALVGSGNHVYENRIIAITTATTDPTGLTSHLVDVQVTNRGLGALEGGVEWTGIITEVAPS